MQCIKYIWINNKGKEGFEPYIPDLQSKCRTSLQLYPKYLICI